MEALMPNRNWGQICTGATFESLATTLVFFEDAGASLFGRRGKDGGQDARSGDRTRVFQAKHHQDGAASKAIADAKKEARKIAKYRTVGHSREPQWRGVTHWRLVTNAAFNPTDKHKWDSEVVPLFQSQGLAADYWEQANLDALLDKHPEVDRAYFQNQTRAFLSLPEVSESLPLREPFLQRDDLGGFVGRQTELGQFQTFLASSHLFLVVHGPGGVGKTRVALEAGERIAADGTWNVLWANVASMEASGNWFDAIVPERPTLLIVDEPDDERVLRVLAEQLGTKQGRASQWKIAITVRSPKDPVLKFLFGPRMKSRVDQLHIEPLPHADAERMCAELLNDGPLASADSAWRASTATELSKRFSSHPIWLTLAVHVLETTGDLAAVPETAEDLAEQYIGEVVGQQASYPPENLHSILRWVALVGTLNREDDTSIELVAGQSNTGTATATRKAIADLVSRRALFERGARNRLVEVKPDVLRDHVLLKWLSVDLGFGDAPIQPSDAAKELAELLLQAWLSGDLTAVGRAILKSLARTELVLGFSGHTVPLLGAFMAELRAAIDPTAASTRMSIARSFVEIAVYRPDDTVALSHALRSSPCPTETVDGIFGPREVGQDDVVLELAWPVFHAAFGSRNAEQRRRVLLELCELAEAESAAASRRPRVLPNDGKRAKDLIGRTLEGGPQFWSDFGDAASEVANALLDEGANLAPSGSRAEVLRALIGPSLSIERRQIWSEGYAFHIQTSTLLPGHPAWTSRLALKNRVQGLVADEETPRGTRMALWPLLVEAHWSINQRSASEPDEVQAMLREEMLADLSWALSVLAPRASDLDEVASARDLWDWHARFEKDPALRAAAEELEALYSVNEVAAEFEWLLCRDDWKEKGPRAVEKARELADAGEGAVDAFLQRARDFFQSAEETYQVFHVAWELGLVADSSEAVREFVSSALSEPAVSPRTDFAAIAGSGWAASKRRERPEHAHELVAELVGACGGNAQRVNLLACLYGQLPPRKDVGTFSAEEFELIRSNSQLFLDAGKPASFIACVGWGIDSMWPTLKNTIEDVLNQVPADQMALVLNVLADAVYWALRDGVSETTPPKVGEWLLEQMLRIHDIDNLGGNLEWRVQEVLKQVGKAPLNWLPKAVSRRRDLEAQIGHGAFRALSHRIRLSSFVTPIEAEGDVEQADTDAIHALLDFVSDSGSVGYYLHELLHDVDPHGRVVPAEVAHRIQHATSEDLAWRLARIGGGYPVGTVPWRTVARSALAQAANAEPTRRRSLYSALSEHGGRSWSGTPGEVPEVFFGAVESARRQLDAESDPVFVRFWKWRLENAEAELRDQEERTKEERGE